MGQLGKVAGGFPVTSLQRAKLSCVVFGSICLAACVFAGFVGATFLAVINGGLSVWNVVMYKKISDLEAK